MMERWRDKQQDNGQATGTIANEQQDVASICPPPLPPSEKWLSNLRGQSDTQETDTTITRGAISMALDAGSTESSEPKASSGVGNIGNAQGNRDSTQKAASGPARKIRWEHNASAPVAQLPHQKRESVAASPAHPAEKTKIIQAEARRRIWEKFLGPKYTTINQKITPVEEDFEHARLDDHNRLDEAFYRFRQLMIQRRRELGLPGSAKPYGRVIIEEEGPPLKRIACILLRPFWDETEVTAYHAILSKSTWREHYTPLTLLYQKQNSELDCISAHPEARLVNAAPKDTLCGSLAMIGNEQRRRVVTVGGLLAIGDKLWATTAAHSISDEDKKSASSTVETLTEDMIHPEEYPEDVAEALIFAKPDEGAQSKPVVPPTYTSAAAAARTDFTRLQLLGEGEESGDDWSLILINDKAMALPNAAHTHDGDGGTLGLDNAVYLVERAGKHPGSCDAEVLAGVSGPVAVKMIPGQVEVPLPSGSWVTAWECLVKSGHCEFLDSTC